MNTPANSVGVDTERTSQSSSTGTLLLSHHNMRDQLHSIVMRDLLGPCEGTDEELDERPRDRYLVGMLAPRSRRSNIESFPAEAAGDIAGVSTAATEDGMPDPGAAPT